MNKIFFYYLIYISFLLSNDCLSTWYNENLYIDSSMIIKTNFDLTISDNVYDSTTLYIDKFNNQVRIDFDNQIMIFNPENSLNIFNETNQLFIDEPDTVINQTIIAFLNKNILHDFYVENNIYIIRDKLNFNEILFEFNKECSDISSLKINNDNFNINISNLIVEHINMYDFNPFIFDKNYFEYDMRRHD